MDAIPSQLDALRVPVDGLTPYGKNPRVGNVDAIVASLEANGQYRPIVVNARTNEVLAGNHTLKAARQLGWAEIAATFVDVDDEQAARIVLVDNRSNDLAHYDDAALVELLRSLESLSGTGFDEEALAALEADLAGDEPVALTDVDDVPSEPRVVRTKVGQTWLLGPHRLSVGDATDPGVIAEALGGDLADLCLTDPPYNVNYEGGTKQALRIENDDMAPEQFKEFLDGFYLAALEHTVAGGPIYVFYASAEEISFRQAMVDAGWLYKQNLVWIKDRFVLSRQDYHWQHEPILYGWKPGAAHRWYGGFTPTTLIDDQPDVEKMTKAELQVIVRRAFEQTTAIREDRPAANVDHPTAKPVALLGRLIEHSSRRGDRVLDPFAGSGSTLIACHHAGRTAALVELDPRYADVICRRYQEHTGDKPVLEATGEPHDFTEG